MSGARVGRGVRPERRHARELVMKALYQRDVGRGRPLETLRYLCAEEGVDAEVAADAARMLEGVLDRLPELDRRVEACSHDWRLERLANVDRNILRLGVYELLYRSDVPRGAAISEAVELAKVYGGPDSGKFVNGVLGQIARELEPGADQPGADQPGADQEEP